MPIERKNSFHLMLSDDELKLLQLLAEQAGLSASDYLRTTMRQLAGAPPHLRQMMHVSALLGSNLDLAKRWSEIAATPPPKRRAKKRAK